MGFAGLLLTVNAAFAANKCGAYRITDSGGRLVALETATVQITKRYAGMERRYGMLAFYTLSTILSPFLWNREIHVQVRGVTTYPGMHC